MLLQYSQPRNPRTSLSSLFRRRGNFYRGPNEHEHERAQARARTRLQVPWLGAKTAGLSAQRHIKSLIVLVSISGLLTAMSTNGTTTMSTSTNTNTSHGITMGTAGAMDFYRRQGGRQDRAGNTTRTRAANRKTRIHLITIVSCQLQAIHFFFIQTGNFYPGPNEHEHDYTNTSTNMNTITGAMLA